MKNERSADLRHDKLKWPTLSSSFCEHFVQIPFLPINMDNFDYFVFGQTTSEGVIPSVGAKQTKCLKLKVILCHLFGEICFPPFQCVLFASQLPSLSIFM